jgi:hypothetical protein
MAAEVGGKIVDAERPLGEIAADLGIDGPLPLKLLTSRDKEALDVLRHSAAHVMARAVMRLYKASRLAFGPTTEGGFYYDFDIPETISEEDFPKIEAEIAKIIKEKEPFERFNLTRDEARKLLRRFGSRSESRTRRHGFVGSSDGQLLSSGRIRRPVPRTAHSRRRQDQSDQVAVGRRIALERRRVQPTAATVVRHRVL